MAQPWTWALSKPGMDADANDPRIPRLESCGVSIVGYNLSSETAKPISKLKNIDLGHLMPSIACLCSNRLNLFGQSLLLDTLICLLVSLAAAVQNQWLHE
jgi:hypothetical protein